MSKTLSIVGFLAIIAGAGVFTAVGQTDPADTTTSPSNHITDEERDRIIKEAIEKAKAQEATDNDDAVPSAPIPAKTPVATPEPTKTPVPQASSSKSKAEEMADDANFPKSKSKKTDDDDSAYSLKPLKLTEKTVDLDTVKTPAPVKTTPTPKPAAAKVESTPKVAVTEATPKPAATAKPSAESDTIKDSDKAISFNDKDLPDGTSQKPPAKATETGDSLRGRVVGIMMPAGRGARILVQEFGGRQVEVTLDEDLDVPTPHSTVALKGRDIGTRGMGLRAFEATSVKLESGTFMQKMPTRQPVPMAPRPMVPGPFMPGPPMMGPPMMPPPPPF